MVQSLSAPPSQYLNITEVLVKREVDRQLEHLPPRVLRFIKRTEVETYALNRLPALYASSTQGLKFQQQRAQREIGKQLETVVRQAIAAVQVDPLRASQPIIHPGNRDSEAVLQALRQLFDRPDMDWQGALQALKRVNKAQLQGQSVAGESPNSSTHRQRWRPGTYGSEVAWRPKTPSAQTLGFDWDDPRYQR